MRGSYILINRLEKDIKIPVGALGSIDFDKGYYCYVGSANGENVNIETRTSRHKKLVSEKNGKLVWHIDYFLTNKNVSLVDIEKLENLDECDVSKKMEKFSEMTFDGFGSSDCTTGCRGHFHYFKTLSSVRDVLKSI